MPKPRLAATSRNLDEQRRDVRVDNGRRVAKAAVRAWLYDRILIGLTAGWYREVLMRLPDGASILDIGIGTGGAIARSAALVRSKNVRIVGLDIDRDYLKQCEKAIARANLTNNVTTQLRSVYDYRGGPYDAAYFSASLMLLPDPVGAIKRVASQLKSNGWIFFTQTFHHGKSPLMEKVKPMLHHFTTIHFGRVTYEDEFRQVLEDAGLKLFEFHTMGSTKRLSYRLAVARPAVDVASQPLDAGVGAFAAESV